MVKRITGSNAKSRRVMRELQALKTVVQAAASAQNRNKAGKKAKKRRRARARRAPTKVGGSLADALMHPSKYPGIKWPDDNAMPTVPLQTRDTFALTTNGSGIAILLANPSLNSIMHVCSDALVTSTTSSLTGRFTAVNTTNYNSLNSTYNARRCVGLELRFFCTQAAINAQGVMLCSSIPQPGTTLSLPVSISSQIASDVQHVVLPLARTITSAVNLHCRTLDYNCRDFIPITLDSAQGWSSVGLYVYGATPNTSIGYAEIIANWELTLAPGSIAIGVTPSAVYRPQELAEAANAVTTSPFMEIGKYGLGGLPAALISAGIGYVTRNIAQARGYGAMPALTHVAGG